MLNLSLLSPSPPPPITLHHYLHLHRHHRRRQTPALLRASPFDSLSSVLSASSVLASIIIVHESGHLLAATLQGIHVSKFAIGFGPVLARYLSPTSGIEFSLRAFPLGGYVAFPDDDDPASPFPSDDPDLLKNRPILDRLLVISAGVAANLAFAYLILLLQLLTVGLPLHYPGVLVPDVVPNSAAARDGILPGDLILSFNDSPAAPSVSELVDVIKLSPNKPLKLSIARPPSQSPIPILVTPDESPDGTGRIGVQLSPNYTSSKLRAANIPEALVLSFEEFVALTETVFNGLKQTLLNLSQSASKVSGPVAIIAVGAEVARSSSDGLFQFAAVINLNLAMINLLPLPALDGGSLALLLVEAARGGRKIPREVEQRIMSSGVLVVLMMGLFLIVRDTLNLDFVKEML